MSRETATAVPPAMQHRPPRLNTSIDQLAKFAGVGSAAMLLYLAFYAELGMWIPAVMANVIGWTVSTLVANELQRRWAFSVNDRNTRRADQTIALTASLIGLALSTAVLAGVPDGFSSLAGIAVILLINLVIGTGRFVLMRWWLITRHA
ncbi:MAG: GtrA family protein [Antricoccus sp.]